PLLPEAPPIKTGDLFGGQPGVWVLDWSWRRQWNPERRFKVTLGRDHSWKAEPGGWRGKWSYDKETKPLSVRAGRHGSRTFRWKVALRRGFWPDAGSPHAVVEGVVKGTCVGTWASLRSWGVGYPGWVPPKR